MSDAPQPAAEINYNVADRDLKYYIFDWDDNILHMPSSIHLEKRLASGEWVPHAVSTSLFSVIRKQSDIRPPNDDWEEAFREFRDIMVDDQNVFLSHTRDEVNSIVRGESKGAPAFEAFKQTLIEGRLFAIVTARGHSAEVIREGVCYFIDKVLDERDHREMLSNLRGYLHYFDPAHAAASDDEVLNYYLDCNKYHAVMSPTFKRMMGEEPGSSPNAELGKQFAIKDFVEHVIQITRAHGLDKPISVGFSDDDDGNVVAVEKFVREAIAKEFPGVKFVVYYTSDPDEPSGRKVVVRGQLSLDL